MDFILDILNTLSNIIIAAASVFAFLTYRYNKKKDNELALLSQITFFRKDVLGASDDFGDLVRKHFGEKTKVYLVKINEMLELDSTRTNEIAEQQKRASNREVHSSEIRVLNNLEEFSLMIKVSGNINSKLLQAVKSSFIRLVETHSYALISVRTIQGGELYATTLEVYLKWRDEK